MDFRYIAIEGPAAAGKSALAERLANGPTLAHGLAKVGVYRAMNMSLEDTLNMEARNQNIAGRSQDRVEGAAAFREKRQPNFIGR